LHGGCCQEPMDTGAEILQQPCIGIHLFMGTSG
jgi:hypothetical protein